MLQIFYDSQDFFLVSILVLLYFYSFFFIIYNKKLPSFFSFQLKELEKLGPRKGVISQSVKDVVQSLVDDDLVSKEKIGTSVSIIFEMKLPVIHYCVYPICTMTYSLRMGHSLRT